MPGNAKGTHHMISILRRYRKHAAATVMILGLATGPVLALTPATAAACPGMSHNGCPSMSHN